MVNHKTMSLFDAPKDAIIIHACNSQGMWGSGIAKAFAEKYPESYNYYSAFCRVENSYRGSAVGRAELRKFDSEPHYVGWIVTSHDYGPRRDGPERIKVNTEVALIELCKTIDYNIDMRDRLSIDVYSNKFNSGLFGVPWEESEAILQTILKNYKRINWIVCSEV